MISYEINEGRILRIQHEAEVDRLRVFFKSGKVIDIEDVGAHLAVNMAKAPSPGEFLVRTIMPDRIAIPID